MISSDKIINIIFNLFLFLVGLFIGFMVYDKIGKPTIIMPLDRTYLVTLVSNTNVLQMIPVKIESAVAIRFKEPQTNITLINIERVSTKETKE